MAKFQHISTSLEQADTFQNLIQLFVWTKFGGEQVILAASLKSFARTTKVIVLRPSTIDIEIVVYTYREPG